MGVDQQHFKRSAVEPTNQRNDDAFGGGQRLIWSVVSQGVVYVDRTDTSAALHSTEVKLALRHCCATALREAGIKAAG